MLIFFCYFSGWNWLQMMWKSRSTSWLKRVSHHLRLVNTSILFKKWKFCCKIIDHIKELERTNSLITWSQKKQNFQPHFRLIGLLGITTCMLCICLINDFIMRHWRLDWDLMSSQKKRICKGYLNGSLLFRLLEYSAVWERRWRIVPVPSVVFPCMWDGFFCFHSLPSPWTAKSWEIFAGVMLSSNHYMILYVNH